mmetsp:Transcript_62753/g.111480  ORF Transcript_62753/g.111480 Transcript_62753/m.111480 type:complete len:210 (+) Transcript_62753:422-1051(+)
MATPPSAAAASQSLPCRRPPLERERGSRQHLRIRRSSKSSQVSAKRLLRPEMGQHHHRHRQHLPSHRPLPALRRPSQPRGKPPRSQQGMLRPRCRRGRPARTRCKAVRTCRPRIVGMLTRPRSPSIQLSRLLRRCRLSGPSAKRLVSWGTWTQFEALIELPPALLELTACHGKHPHPLLLAKTSLHRSTQTELKVSSTLSWRLSDETWR